VIDLPTAVRYSPGGFMFWTSPLNDPLTMTYDWSIRCNPLPRQSCSEHLGSALTPTATRYGILATTSRLVVFFGELERSRGKVRCIICTCQFMRRGLIPHRHMQYTAVGDQ
jgi:hypothetical protein